MIAMPMATDLTDQEAKKLVNTLTQVMSDMSTHRGAGLLPSVDSMAWDHLALARKLLIAKYQPQLGPRGV